MRSPAILALVAVPLALTAACTTTASTSPAQAVLTLRLADGTAIGTATARPEGTAIRLSLHVAGLAAGERGVHVHAIGKCDGPDFASAGGHWNPRALTHGLAGGDGQYAGDMPNLVLDASGGGRLDYVLQGGSFAELLDADGAAFVLHAGRDDQATDPSGNSGARVACGVFAPG